MKKSMSSLFKTIVFLSLIVTLPAVQGCSTAKVATGEIKGTENISGPGITTSRPAVIHVKDFKLMYEKVNNGGVIQRQGVSRLLPPALKKEDSRDKAQKLVYGMTEALIAGFREKGVAVNQLKPEAPLPTDGWLVSGEFLDVTEGSRAVRATIGFGAGAKKMEVAVSVYDLAKGLEQPLMEFGTEKVAGKMPGAAVTMNPYAAAVKFVLDDNAAENDLKETASKIIATILQEPVAK